jgi:hypothetical protein
LKDTSNGQPPTPTPMKMEFVGVGGSPKIVGAQHYWF